jgi:very-short-patch-repair endonuclease
MTTSDITTLALAAPWRDGADEALFVLDHLDRRSRSVKESETRAILAASGLPAPQLNHRISLGDDATAFGDLVYVEQGLVVEFEGGHHQEDRDQYVRDIERFALFRGHGVPYLQVTRETLDRPRTLVGTVYRTLVSLGYDGPAPEFGDRWTSLFRPVRELLPPRRTRLRELAAGR